MCEVKGCLYPGGSCRLLDDVGNGELKVVLKPKRKRVIAREGDIKLTEHSFELVNPYLGCQLRTEQQPPKQLGESNK